MVDYKMIDLETNVKLDSLDKYIPLYNCEVPFHQPNQLDLVCLNPSC